MAYPKPITGLVIRYSYLWRDEKQKGQVEGRKNRPCAVVVVTQNPRGQEYVTVLPITHSAPQNATDALEIPLKAKRRLGLDDLPSWIVLTEANRFPWPGPDLRPAIAGDSASVGLGLLPSDLITKMLDGFVSALERKRAQIVNRDD